MLSDYQTLVADLARDDDDKVDANQLDRAIAAAVERYSTDRPVEKAEDLTPASANLLPLPGAWVVDFSGLKSLEFPIGSIPPTYVPAEEISFYRSPAALQILLKNAVTVAAGSVRSVFTIKHTVSAIADTIPVQHREPVACWAAAMLCDELATFYSASTDSSIQADSVKGDSKAREFSARAKTLRSRYLNELGIEDKRSAPAGGFATQTKSDSWGGPRLMHPPAPRA